MCCAAVPGEGSPSGQVRYPVRRRFAKLHDTAYGQCVNTGTSPFRRRSRPSTSVPATKCWFLPTPGRARWGRCCSSMRCPCSSMSIPNLLHGCPGRRGGHHIENPCHPARALRHAFADMDALPEIARKHSLKIVKTAPTLTEANGAAKERARSATWSLQLPVQQAHYLR